MRKRRLSRSCKIGLVIAAIALLSVLAYGELVLDWRVASARQNIRFTMGVTQSVEIAEYNSFEHAMRRKYGAAVDTKLPLDTGVAEVRLNGAVMETNSDLKRIDGVYGIFLLGSDDSIRTRFPFEVSAGFGAANSKAWITEHLKKSFRRAPQIWFAFDDNDWMLDRCTASPRDLGLGPIGTALRLRGGTSCVTIWKGKQLPGSMLISVTVADGNPWMRPFTRRLCRAVTEAALGQLTSKSADRPNYAACVLIDRPELHSARKSLTVDAYSIAENGDLHRMDFSLLAPAR
ncbi:MULTISPECIES: hypothetical protein [unclassified Bradyrhizobium]|uniref:hypothetical protein n=1 Tax=unclassified Bradyrhizobium TaxID=2631580 RepID=UPI0028E2E617|nr:MULTISPECIES: hypothetical protein [unclassified Bradyrhizobium]